MTKKEMEKKRDELASTIEIPYFAKSFSERAGHIASFKDGWDACAEEYEKKLTEAYNAGWVECSKEYEKALKEAFAQLKE